MSRRRSRGKQAGRNLFRDLGFSKGEAENLRLRSELMIHLGGLIESRRLKQAEAARLLGVTQPRISDLMRGKIDRFSVDTLVNMLARAGVSVRIALRKRSA